MTDSTGSVSTPPSVEQVHDALTPVIDPELGYSIVELGLVRGIEVQSERRRAVIRLTLTSPMCPLGPEIIADVKQAALALSGLEQVEVELVWTPPWDPRTDASDDVKADFGVWD